MKRDMDLIRGLMLKLEALSSSHRVVTFTADDEEIAVQGYDPEQIEYHLALIWEAGWIDTGTNGSGMTASGEFMFRRLTTSGHDFVDSVRDPEVWQQTKGAATKAGGWTLGVLKDLGTAYLKHIIKERAGIDLG